MIQIKREPKTETATTIFLMSMLSLSVAAISSIAGYSKAVMADLGENLEIKDIAASPNSNRDPDNAIDNDLSTKWNREGKGSRIQHDDLGEQKMIIYVDIAWYNGDSRINNFAISTSSDGISYRNVYSGKSSGNALVFERYDSADVEARYLKITVNGNQWNDWASINEIEIYSDDVGASHLAIDFANLAKDQAGEYRAVVSASDPSNVDKIDFYIDSTFIETENWPPYEFDIETTDFSNGNHIIKTVATDESGNSVTKTITVSIQNPQKVTTTTSSSSSEKFFLAFFLQYVDEDAQVSVYKPNMGSKDMTLLRASSDDELKSEYIEAAKSLPGLHGVSFKSSAEVVENAKRVKDLGFDFIEFNLESGPSPSSDNNDVVGAMKRAAEAAHEQGLEFRAAPSKAYTTKYGSQIASFVDFYHIQAQSLQDDGVAAYSDYVHTMAAKLKSANPDLLISVQVSTQMESSPGLSLLETLKQCTDSVMDVADGVSVWYGRSDLDTLEEFVEWYNAKY